MTYTQNELMGSLIAHEEMMKKILERSLKETFQTKVQVSKGQSKQEGTHNYTQLGRGRGRSFCGCGRGRFGQRLKALEQLKFRQDLDRIRYLRMFIMFQSLSLIS